MQTPSSGAGRGRGAARAGLKQGGRRTAATAEDGRAPCGDPFLQERKPFHSCFYSSGPQHCQTHCLPHTRLGLGAAFASWHSHQVLKGKSRGKKNDAGRPQLGASGQNHAAIPGPLAGRPCPLWPGASSAPRAWARLPLPALRPEADQRAPGLPPPPPLPPLLGCPGPWCSLCPLPPSLGCELALLSVFKQALRSSLKTEPS